MDHNSKIIACEMLFLFFKLSLTVAVDIDKLTVFITVTIPFTDVIV